MEPGTRFALVYLLAVNVLSMALFALDKQRASGGGWRIPEKYLHLAGLAGGFPAGFLAMRLFRHKRRKLRFVAAYVLVSLVSAAGIGYVAVEIL